MVDPNKDDFSRYSELILGKLKELDKKISILDEKVVELRVEQASIKTKIYTASAAIAFIMGAIVNGIPLLSKFMGV